MSLKHSAIFVVCRCVLYLSKQSKRDSPSSSLGVAFNQSRSREGSDAGLVMAPPAGGSQRQISAEELRRQFSTNSTSSVDSVCDIAVTQSLIDLQRLVVQMHLYGQLGGV